METMAEIRNLLIILIFLKISSHMVDYCRVSAEDGIDCDMNATSDIWSETSDTFIAMINDFGSTCDRDTECTFSSTPVRTLTTKFYNTLIEDNNFFEQYSDSCSDLGMEMCFVSSIVKMNSNQLVETNVASLTQVIREIRKPICFPNSCEEDQMEFLDPYPSMCELAGDACQIIETEVSCPEGRVPTGDSFYCESQIPVALSQVTLNKIALYSQMEGNCADVLLGGSNKFCAVQHRDGEISQFLDYSNFKDQHISYQRFKSNCRKKGGKECFTDFSLLGGVDLPTAGMFYNLTGVDYPFCFPSDCSKSSLTDLAGQIILSNFGTIDVGGDIGVVNLCNLPNGGCQFGYNFYCGQEKDMLQIKDAVEEEIETEIEFENDKENNQGPVSNPQKNNKPQDSSYAVDVRRTDRIFFCVAVVLGLLF